MEKLTIKLTGESALLLHSDRGANPLDKDVLALKRLTVGRKKTEEVLHRVAEQEWEIGLYFDEKLGPYVPAFNVRSALIEGGKLKKMGAAIKRGVLVAPGCEKIRLDYTGPRDLVGMWNADPPYYDARTVVVGTSRVMRYRPMFREWSLSPVFMYDPGIIQPDQIVTALEDTGSYVGLGDFRVANGGPFGRFTVEAHKKAKAA